MSCIRRAVTEYFDHSRFPFKRLHTLGFNICLGTDSLASNENLNLFAEMRAFQRSEPERSPEKIFEMITVNPASALRQQNTLGRIRPGFRADLIAIPCGEDRDLFGEIVAFDGEVNWMHGQRKDAENRELTSTNQRRDSLKTLHRRTNVPGSF